MSGRHLRCTVRELSQRPRRDDAGWSKTACDRGVSLAAEDGMYRDAAGRPAEDGFFRLAPWREIIMQSKWLLSAFAVALILPTPWAAQAFECPKHFDAAEDAIDAASDAMIGLKTDLHMIRGHMLLDDAKMLLGAAEHNHAKPQYEYDHARAIGKAEAAKGYAEAALIYYKKFGTKQ